MSDIAKNKSEQLTVLRAQFAALTKLLKEVPAGDGKPILSPERHVKLDEYCDQEVKKLTAEKNSLSLG